MILYAGNLSRSTTRQELIALFAPFGDIIRIKVMADRITRRSHGYAYIDMSDAGGAADAVEKLNCTSFMGSFIMVGPANIKRLHEIDWS